MYRLLKFSLLILSFHFMFISALQKNATGADIQPPWANPEDMQFSRTIWSQIIKLQADLKDVRRNSGGAIPAFTPTGKDMDRVKMISAIYKPVDLIHFFYYN